MRRQDECHWCHYCRSVIRNDATVNISLRGTHKPRFFFHMNCYEKWNVKGAQMLPGAMMLTAVRVGLVRRGR